MVAATKREVDAQTAAGWLKSGEAVLIDVREGDEYARERIAGSRLVPLSCFDDRAAAGPGKVVVHCRSGRRSADAIGRLPEGAEAYSLKGGIQGWKAAGLPVEGNPRAPLPMFRQVLIGAGTFVLIWTALAAFVSPWFLILDGIMGVGMVFAGTTGICGMAAVLSLMPWNRRAARCPS